MFSFTFLPSVLTYMEDVMKILNWAMEDIMSWLEKNRFKSQRRMAFDSESSWFWVFPLKPHLGRLNIFKTLAKKATMDDHGQVTLFILEIPHFDGSNLLCIEQSCLRDNFEDSLSTIWNCYILTGKWWYYHIRQLLQWLSWLLIDFQMQFKVLVITYKP